MGKFSNLVGILVGKGPLQKEKILFGRLDEYLYKSQGVIFFQAKLFRQGFDIRIQSFLRFRPHDIVDAPAQAAKAERLLYEATRTCTDQLVSLALNTVPAAQKNLDFGVQPAKLTKNLAPPHCRHDNIKDYQHDILAMLPKQL